MRTYVGAFGPTCDGGLIANCSHTVCLLGSVMDELIKDGFIIATKAGSQIYKLVAPVNFKLLES